MRARPGAERNSLENWLQRGDLGWAGAWNGVWRARAACQAATGAATDVRGRPSFTGRQASTSGRAGLVDRGSDLRSSAGAERVPNAVPNVLVTLAHPPAVDAKSRSLLRSTFVTSAVNQSRIVRSLRAMVSSPVFLIRTLNDRCCDSTVRASGAKWHRAPWFPSARSSTRGLDCSDCPAAAALLTTG
jgi:hypothetical protein